MQGTFLLLTSYLSLITPVNEILGNTVCLDSLTESSDGLWV